MTTRTKMPSYVSSEKKIAKLETEVKSTEQMGKNMQKVCAYMTRVATDGSRKRGKDVAGVMKLAEQSVRSFLQENDVFVSDKVWPNWKRMPENWIVFSTNIGTMSFRSVYNIRSMMPFRWTHERIWLIFLVALTVEQLKSIRSQKNFWLGIQTIQK